LLVLVRLYIHCIVVNLIVGFRANAECKIAHQWMKHW